MEGGIGMSERSRMNLTASFLVPILLAGCGGSDPIGPDPISGITVFARPDYRGPHRTFVHDVEDLKLLIDDPQPDEDDCAAKLFGQEYWTDCVSSIRVSEGWQAIVYEHDNFRGDSLTVTVDIPDLRAWTWDDRISSLRVRR